MIKNRIAVSMALGFVFFLSFACAAVEYKIPFVEDPQRVIDKNYEIDKQQEAYAGDKMMEAKNYVAFFSTHHKMKASNNFTIEGPGVKHKGSKGDTYNLILTTDVNEQMKYYIEIPGVFRRYGLGPEGQWENVYYFEGQAVKAETPITPEDTTFEHVSETRLVKADPSKTYTHFEIIYTGKTQDAINLVYREYMPDSPEESAYQKDLSYPIDTEIIRHEQIEIKIHEVADESISYTVIDDGLDDWSLYKRLCQTPESE